MDQKLKDKGVELRDWYDKKLQVLLRQQETLSMMRDDAIAREVCLGKRKALLDTRE